MKNQAGFQCSLHVYLTKSCRKINLSAGKAACYTSFITSSAFHNIIVQDNIQDDRGTCFPYTGNQIGEDEWTDRRTDGARVGVRSREYQIFSDGQITKFSQLWGFACTRFESAWSSAVIFLLYYLNIGLYVLVVTQGAATGKCPIVSISKRCHIGLAHTCNNDEECPNGTYCCFDDCRRKCRDPSGGSAGAQGKNMAN